MTECLFPFFQLGSLASALDLCLVFPITLMYFLPQLSPVGTLSPGFPLGLFFSINHNCFLFFNFSEFLVCSGAVVKFFFKSFCWRSWSLEDYLVYM